MRIRSIHLRWAGLFLGILGAVLWWASEIGAFRQERPWYQETAIILFAVGAALLIVSFSFPRLTTELPDPTERLRKFRLEEANRRALRRNLVLLAAMVAALGLVLYFRTDEPQDPNILLGTLVFTLIPLIAWMFFGSEYLQRELEALRDQLMEESGPATPGELRAERFFLLHRAELDRYYVQARAQSGWVLAAGLIAVTFGAGIVVATLFLVFQQTIIEDANSTAEPIVTSLVGGVTGVLTSFVGALILKMYEGTSKALNDFHRRLVMTNHLYFGNLLLAKVRDEDKREGALIDIAKSLPTIVIQADSATQLGEIPP